MPIDENIRAIWAEQIKSRLTGVLRHHITKGICLQEFMMAGKRPSALKPTLVVNCGDAETRRIVEKTFNNQHWLKELLKDNGIMFVALVAKVSLSSFLASGRISIPPLSDIYAIPDEWPDLKTSCGLPLLATGAGTNLQQECTLGGLLMVNGQIVGLTAGHPFRKREHCVCPSGLEVEVQDEGPSAEPFIFNQDCEDEEDGWKAPHSSLPKETKTPFNDQDESHEQREATNSLLSWKFPIFSQKATLPCIASTQDVSAEDLVIEYDWALLEGLPQRIQSRPNLQPNETDSTHSDHDIYVTETVTGTTSGDVSIILTPTRSVTGYLHSSLTIMHSDQSIFEVQLVTFERVMRKSRLFGSQKGSHRLIYEVVALGSSGTWVILGNKLCGYIIAIRQDIPWAYMVPIEPALADIKRNLKTNDVRLPTFAEISSLSVISRRSTEATSGADSRQSLGTQQTPNRWNTPELQSTEHDNPKKTTVSMNCATSNTNSRQSLEIQQTFSKWNKPELQPTERDKPQNPNDSMISATSDADLLQLLMAQPMSSRWNTPKLQSTERDKPQKPDDGTKSETTDKPKIKSKDDWTYQIQDDAVVPSKQGPTLTRSGATRRITPPISSPTTLSGSTHTAKHEQRDRQSPDSPPETLNNSRSNLQNRWRRKWPGYPGLKLPRRPKPAITNQARLPTVSEVEPVELTDLDPPQEVVEETAAKRPGGWFWCIMWDRFEGLMLRTEYERRNYRRAPLSRGHFRLRAFEKVLDALQLPYSGWLHPLANRNVGFMGMPTVGLKILYCFFRVLEVLLSQWYFILCSPILIWLAYRHRDVLSDSNKLQRQRHRSIKMLRDLPDIYGDRYLIDLRGSKFADKFHDQFDFV